MNSHRLQVQSSDTNILAVSRGEGGMHILPDTPNDAVVFVTGDGYLSEHSARKLGQFLIDAADQCRAAEERKQRLRAARALPCACGEHGTDTPCPHVKP